MKTPEICIVHEKENNSFARTARAFLILVPTTRNDYILDFLDDESTRRQFLAKFPHSPILHYACRSLLTENNGKNIAIAMGQCAILVVFWWRNKGLHTLNRMHNEVWGCAEI